MTKKNNKTIRDELDLKKVKEKIVYTGGTFDLFHSGHVNFLSQCRKIGQVVVSLNTDDFIQKYKGKPPVMSYSERERVLSSSSYIDKIIPNEGRSNSKKTILKVNPDFIVIGDDWAKKDYYSQMGFTQKWLDNNNIGLIYVPYTKNISTTAIKLRLKK